MMVKKLHLLILLLTVMLPHQAAAVTVTSVAGKLADVVTNHDVTELVINGTLDARDFKFISDELTKIKSLNLSNATIKAYKSDVDDGLYLGGYSYADNTLPYCALTGIITLQTLYLPNNLVAIDYGALAGCSALQSISFPSSLETIGDDAFNSCNALSSVQITHFINRLGSKAFAHCAKLASVLINPSVPLEIGNEAFADCPLLSSVRIGPKVTSIGDGAFTACFALKDIVVWNGSQLASIGDEAFYNSGLKRINFDSMPLVKHLGAWALARTKLQNVSVPSQIKSLDQGTFFYSKSLSRIELPRTLSYLPDYMLAGCDNINGTSFMTQNLGSIGDYAIYNQSQHTSIGIPFRVYYIGTQAMAGMTGLQEITSEPLAVPELGDDVWAGINKSEVNLYVNEQSLNNYKAAEQWMDFIIGKAHLRGDINSDGFVNTADAVAECQYLVDGYTQGIDVGVTDVSGDGEENVADVVSIYNIINGTVPIDAPVRYYFDDLIDGNGVTAGLNAVKLGILLENTRNYTAFQLNIVTPQGVSINGVALADRDIGHEIYLKEESSNNYMVMGFSPAGDDIAGYEGAIFTLNISSSRPIGLNEKIQLNEINFVDSQENVYRRHARYLNIIGMTAVEDIDADVDAGLVDVYNTQGQLLRKGVERDQATQGLAPGIYIVGGKKEIVR